LEVGGNAEIKYQSNNTWKAVLDHPYLFGGMMAIGTPLIAAGASALYYGTSLLAGLGIMGAQGNKVDNAINFTQKYGQSVGEKMVKIGEVFSNEGIKISEHGLYRTVTREARGITPENVIDTFNQGARYWDKIYNN